MTPAETNPPGGPDSAASTPAERARRTLPSHFLEKSTRTDTAGVSWEGRDYSVSPFPDDDGSTPAPLARALARHEAGEDPELVEVAAALAGSRVLVPIMAVATETGTTAHGLTGDNGADMAMVSITAPDGTRVLPLFTSTSALADWRRDARPVPVVAPQAAQAAVQEGCTELLLDGSLRLQRSILWALAQGRTWVPAHADPELAAELAQIAEHTSGVLGLEARPGRRAEVDLAVRLVAGLDRAGVDAVVQDLSGRLGASVLVAERISSLALRLEG